MLSKELERNIIQTKDGNLKNLIGNYLIGKF
jgi:hypothetical protein